MRDDRFKRLLRSEKGMAEMVVTAAFLTGLAAAALTAGLYVQRQARQSGANLNTVQNTYSSENVARSFAYLNDAGQTPGTIGRITIRPTPTPTPTPRASSSTRRPSPSPTPSVALNRFREEIEYTLPYNPEIGRRELQSAIASSRGGNIPNTPGTPVGPGITAGLRAGGRGALTLVGPPGMTYVAQTTTSGGKSYCGETPGIARQRAVDVCLYQPPPPLVTILANGSATTTVRSGERATISWAGEGSCQVAGPLQQDDTARLPFSAGQASEVLNYPAGQASYSVPFSIVCDDLGGTSRAVASVQVLAPDPKILTFTTSDNDVFLGDKVNLRWTTDKTTSCSVSPAITGANATLSNGGGQTLPLTVEKTYVFTLTCIGLDGDTVSKDVSVESSPRPGELDLRFSGSTMPRPVFVDNLPTVAKGKEAFFSWTTKNMSRCAVTPAIPSNGAALNGNNVRTGPLNSVGDITYRLQCTGQDRQTYSDQVKIKVVEGPNITSFKFVPNGPAPSPAPVASSGRVEPIVLGSSAKLSWTSDNATSCAVSPAVSGADIAKADGNGVTGSLTPSGIHRYRLTCTGYGLNDTQDLNVPVGTITAMDFDASPDQIMTGSSSTLAWKTVGAQRCTVSSTNRSAPAVSRITPANGVSTATASMVTASTGVLREAGEYEYVLSCRTGNETFTAKTTVTVSDYVDFDSFYAEVNGGAPKNVFVDDFARLHWKVNHASTCAVSVNTGETAVLDASESTSPIDSAQTPVFGSPGRRIYTLTCQGANGTKGVKSLLPINVLPLPKVTAFAGAAVNEQEAGTLTWTATDADSCQIIDPNRLYQLRTTRSGNRLNGQGTTARYPVPGLYEFKIRCSKAHRFDDETAQLKVKPVAGPSIDFFSLVSPRTPIYEGETTSLKWATSDATSCVLNPGGTRVATASNGTTTAAFANSGWNVMNLACVGALNKTTSADIRIYVREPEVPECLSFTAASARILTGESNSLSWTTRNTASCAVRGSTGAPAATVRGSAARLGVFNNDDEYTYTLTCQGPHGGSCSRTTTIQVDNPTAPTICGFGIDNPGATYFTGDSMTFRWCSNDAESCSIAATSGGGPLLSARTPDGSTSAVFPAAGTFGYRLTCKAPDEEGGQTAHADVRVTVQRRVAPTETFWAEPGQIAPYHTARFRWRAVGATSCGVTPPRGAPAVTVVPGSTAAGGAVDTKEFTTAGTYAYTLTCYGTGGAKTITTASVKVVWPAITATISAQEPVVPYGLPATIRWTAVQGDDSTRVSCRGKSSGGEQWSGPGGESLQVHRTDNLTAGRYTFTVTCVGGGGLQKTVNVGVRVIARVPIYRFYNQVNGLHLFQTNRALPGKDWKSEGVGFYAWAEGSNNFGIGKNYRYYLKTSGNHYLTGDSNEINQYVTVRSDFDDEGNEGYVIPIGIWRNPANPVPGLNGDIHEINHCYNTKNGDHIYNQPCPGGDWVSHTSLGYAPE